MADNCEKAEEIKWGVKVPSGVTLGGTLPNYRITGLTREHIPLLIGQVTVVEACPEKQRH
ncbi:MAG: hypothetical protein IPJ39_20705 [Saprospiraceae bacterium]|nr:hypothetical protein [Saprospiraceae bacterium]